MTDEKKRACGMALFYVSISIIEYLYPTLL